MPLLSDDTQLTRGLSALSRRQVSRFSVPARRTVRAPPGCERRSASAKKRLRGLPPALPSLWRFAGGLRAGLITGALQRVDEAAGLPQRQLVGTSDLAA